MYVYGRLASTLLRARREPRLALDDVVRTPLKIWPIDLDTNGHVNNGRYLTLGDIGRFHLVMRMGLARTMLKRRWFPVVATAYVRFRRSLVAFDRIVLTTRILWWDEKWIYIEHRFLRQPGDEDCATILIKALFRDRKGNVPTLELLRAMGHEGAAPEEPEVIRRWRAMEETPR